MRYVMVLAMFACGGEKPSEDADDTDADADTDADSDTDADTDTDTDSDSDTDNTGVPAGETFEPFVVGFEYTGGVLSDGTLTGFRFPNDPVDTTQQYAPYITLTFASEEYYEATDEAGRLAESCIARAYLQGDVPIASPPIPTAPEEGGDDPIFTYEFALPTIAADATTCFDNSDGGKLDAAAWGPGGTTDLLDAFDGARFGLAFGPLTPYIEAAFGPDTLADPEFMGSVFTEYIAINDLEGNWVGRDWGYGLTFAWDEETHEVEVDGTSLTFLPLNGGFPSAYVQSGTYWSQDFPLIDFSNLKDGAPQ